MLFSRCHHHFHYVLDAYGLITYTFSKSLEQTISHITNWSQDVKWPPITITGNMSFVKQLNNFFMDEI